MWWFGDRRVIRGVMGAGRGSGRPIGAPVRMVVLIQPATTGVTGQPLAGTVFVGFIDAFGNIVSAQGTVVTATPSAGTMSGTTAVQASELGAAFSNLIFDDIANTIISSRTITFSASGFSNVVSSPVTVTDSTVKLWVEADYGIVDADGAPLTAWADRSPTGTIVAPATGKSAPIYRSTGFGGANLPYWDMLNAHGMSTPQLPQLALSTSTEFYVVQRDPADGNCAIAHLHSDTISNAIQDSAASAYVSRWNAGHTVLSESSYSQPTWIPKGSRQIIRQEYDGTHAGHKLFLNGVQQTLTNQLVQNPGIVPSSAMQAHLGFRPGSPALDLLGQYAAAIIITPMASAAKAASVENYLSKWLAAGPAVPTAFRGPIRLASQVIDGVTVDVHGWAPSGTPDFASIDHLYGLLIFAFSEPIKRFRGTLVFGQTAPQGLIWTRLLMGARNFLGPFNYDPVVGAGYAPAVNNQTVQINDSVTGFTHVITQLAPISGPGFSPTSVFKDCYFSKMSDP